MDVDKVEDKRLPDYGKIIFLGIPLTFFVWVVALFSVAGYCRNIKTAMTLSILISVIFYIAFFFVAMKLPGFCKLKNCKSDTNILNKNVSTKEAIFYLIMLLSMIPVAVIGSYLMNKFGINNPRAAGAIGGLVLFPILAFIKNRFFKDIF